MVYFIFGNGVAALKHVFASQHYIDREEYEKFSNLAPATIEMEMHQSYMHRGPVNDYFNQSISEQSVKQMYNRLNKSMH